MVQQQSLLSRDLRRPMCFNSLETHVSALFQESSAQATQAPNVVPFFSFLCGRSAWRDVWHILLNNDRMNELPVIGYPCLRGELWVTTV